MTPRPAHRCPHCGETSEIVSRGKRHALYPMGFLVFISIPIAMIHQVSCPSIYRCLACGSEFEKRSIAAKFCLIILILLVLWVIAAVLSAWLM